MCIGQEFMMGALTGAFTLILLFLGLMLHKAMSRRVTDTAKGQE